MTSAPVDDRLAYVQQTRGRIRPTHMYYRQPNGWITMAAGTMIERAKFSERGWEPLREYGMFDMGNVWCADNPLTTLFQFGGAKELPLDQVIEMGFYFNAPLVPTCRQAVTELHNHSRDCYIGARPAEFPQLKGVKIDGPFTCTFCDRSPLPTRKALQQHEQVAHKDERSSIPTGKTLATHLVEGLTQGGAFTQRDAAAPAPAPAPVDDVAAKALDVLASVGLNQKQIKALAEAGFSVGPSNAEPEAE